jgi:hypothetical protein
LDSWGKDKAQHTQTKEQKPMALKVLLRRGYTHPFSVVEPYTAGAFQYEKEHATNLTHEELCLQFPALKQSVPPPATWGEVPAEWVDGGILKVAKTEVRHCWGGYTDKYLIRDGKEIPIYRIPSGKKAPEGFVPVSLINDCGVDEWGWDGEKRAIKTA